MSKGFPSWLTGSRFWATSQPPRIARGFPLGRPLQPPGRLSRLSPFHSQPSTSRSFSQVLPACRPAACRPKPNELLDFGPVSSLRSLSNQGSAAASIRRLQCRTYSEERPKVPQSPQGKNSTPASSETGQAQHVKSSQSPQSTSPVDRGETSSHDVDSESIASSVSKYLHLPKMPHRPTKEELLAAANGFWDRVRVRFKWMSIRSMRPWNADEWGAFVSWFMLGHLVWILVGTTTFFSLLIFSINTVFAQGRRYPKLQGHVGVLTVPRNSGEVDWRLLDTICRCHRRL